MKRKKPLSIDELLGPEDPNSVRGELGQALLEAVNPGSTKSTEVKKSPFSRSNRTFEDLVGVENSNWEKDHDRILSLAVKIFVDPEKAARWLNKPKSRFQGQTPVQRMKTPEGLREVEHFLIEIQEGIF